MTDTVDDGANRVIPLQPGDVERTEDYPDVETSEASSRVDADERPFYVGHWILRLPLAAPMRTLYEHQVAISNRDLAAYFDASKYISERDRRLARESFLWMLKRVNAYQPWPIVINLFRNAVRYAAVFPSWLVFATVTSVLLWTSAPLAIKISYACLSLLFVLTGVHLFNKRDLALISD